jgi:colicin import membrane protein
MLVYLHRTDDEKARAAQAGESIIVHEAARSTSPTEAIMLAEAGLPQPTIEMQQARSLDSDSDAPAPNAVYQPPSTRPTTTAQKAAAAKAAAIAAAKAKAKAEADAKAAAIAAAKAKAKEAQSSDIVEDISDAVGDAVEKVAGPEARKTAMMIAPVVGALLLGVLVIGAFVYVSRKG